MKSSINRITYVPVCLEQSVQFTPAFQEGSLVAPSFTLKVEVINYMDPISMKPSTQETFINYTYFSLYVYS